MPILLKNIKPRKLSSKPIRTKTADLTIDDSYNDDHVSIDSTSNVTATLNADAVEGTTVTVSRNNTGGVYFVASEGATLRSQGNKYYLDNQWSVATLLKISSTDWHLSGDLSTTLNGVVEQFDFTGNAVTIPLTMGTADAQTRTITGTSVVVPLNINNSQTYMSLTGELQELPLAIGA